MSLNYPRFDVVMARGEGSELFDADGKRYLDLFAGFGAGTLGHCHPDLVAAVTDQARTLWHVGNLLHTDPQTRLAEAIATMGFGGRSFFCHSGADANDAAIKLARLYGKANPGRAAGDFGRYKVVSATRSFHGRSFATMVATANPAVRAGFEPLLPGFAHCNYNDIDALASAIDDETVAVIVEPIQGEGGVNIPDSDYLPAVRALCDEHDLLWIDDEVWTGGGRTGKVFGYQHWSATPDIMTLGKGVGGGLPVGVMCAADRIAELYDARKQGAVKHASTLGGNCLSMAAAATVFAVIARDNLTQRAADLGAHAMGRLRSLADDTGLIANVRGRGLFIGFDLAVDSEDAWFKAAADVVRKALEMGLVVGSAGAATIRLAPAITIEQAALDEGIELLARCLRG